MKNRQAGFSLMELMVVLAIILLLVGGGYMVYDQFIKKGKVSRLLSDLQNLETAQNAFYNDTGTYAGMTPEVPFPDALLNRQAITNQDIAQRWRGPYLKVRPQCPYDNCVYQTDFTTGAATNVGETYLYFIVATNVPLEDALEASRKVNGNDRVENGECLTADIPNAVAGASLPCRIYLSQNTGGAGTRVDVFYTFATGTL